ncbi:Uncharacterised protein [Vibrio cholerae]|nr:Uncharacterised protein [Vibrio cholerae]
MGYANPSVQTTNRADPNRAAILSIVGFARSALRHRYEIGAEPSAENRHP